MMGRTKLTDEVDISSLMHLRDEGYSNAEIAEQLGVCKMTVYRYIGKQPKEIASERMRAGKEKAEVERIHDLAERMRKAPERKIEMDKPSFEDVVIDNTLPDAMLAIKERIINLEGTSGMRYTVCHERATIWSGSDNSITVDAKHLREFAAEIRAILRHIDETNAKNQLWD